MVACQSGEVPGFDSAEIPPATQPPTATQAITQVEPTATATTVPTIAATNTTVPTLPPPPTLTQAPTEIPPTASPKPPPTAAPSPKPTSEATAVATVEHDAGDCLSADAVADAQSPYVVVDGPWPRGGASTVEIYTGNNNPNLIHLGFDVEGDPGQLAAILDILDRRQVKTTMFIVGNWAETYPDWVKEFVARGHELANHSQTHGNLGDMSYEQVQAELNNTETTVMRITGLTTKPWLRPPFGSRSEVSIQASADAGWSTVIWSGSPDDWRPEYDAEDMCDTLLATSYPGGILYAHPWRPEMPEVVDRYIGTLQSQGYTFVPLSVMMSNNPSEYLLPNE